MKNIVLIILLFTLLAGCKKSDNSVDGSLYSGTVVPIAAKAVTKSNTKKVFVHVMPWFESKESIGSWGQHWTMANANPEVVDGTGKRQIASYFYPNIGPYASSDTIVIEYQLLLMKLSGIDGVLIDWPGKQNLYDYPYMVRNTERMVNMLQKVGLNFAIVYEDQNLVNVSAGNKISQAQTDMTYLQNTFFNLTNYEKVSGSPMLLVFGPQQLQTASNWTSVFSALSLKPSFFTIWYQSSEAGSNANGEFAWVGNLSGFYNNGYTGIKIAGAYPGFKDYYSAGGWGSSYPEISHNGTLTFSSALDQSLATSLTYLQLITWNDYGEGTMIEPTREFGYSFLTMLQSKLGVSSLTQTELEMVDQIYRKRKSAIGNTEAQKKLTQVFYYVVSLQMDKAKKLLDSI